MISALQCTEITILFYLCIFKNSMYFKYHDAACFCLLFYYEFKNIEIFQVVRLVCTENFPWDLYMSFTGILLHFRNAP